MKKKSIASCEKSEYLNTKIINSKLDQHKNESLKKSLAPSMVNITLVQYL